MPTPARRGPDPHRGAAVAVGIFGLLVAVAAVQNSRNADLDEASRNALVERIEVRKDAVSTLQDRIVDLRAQNDDLLDLVMDLTTAGQNLDQAIDDLELMPASPPSPARACA